MSEANLSQPDPVRVQRLAGVGGEEDIGGAATLESTFAGNGRHLENSFTSAFSELLREISESKR